MDIKYIFRFKYLDGRNIWCKYICGRYILLLEDCSSRKAHAAQAI
jgi:hypothetical protein